MLKLSKIFRQLRACSIKALQPLYTATNFRSNGIWFRDAKKLFSSIQEVDVLCSSARLPVWEGRGLMSPIQRNHQEIILCDYSGGQDSRHTYTLEHGSLTATFHDHSDFQSWSFYLVRLTTYCGNWAQLTNVLPSALNSRNSGGRWPREALQAKLTVPPGWTASQSEFYLILSGKIRVAKTFYAF